MIRKLLILSAGLWAAPAVSAISAQSVDSLVAKYIQASGGMAKIQAIQTLRRTGKFTGGGGFEAVVVQENKRPNSVRNEFSIQGMTGINAYDGQNGWKIEPWNGKKDSEPLGEEEKKAIIEDSDFDGPLVNYAAKGNKVEYVGIDPVQGDDTYKLKVTLKSGDVKYYYMDTDYYVPIKIESKRMVRGEERESETYLGDYKEVNGVYFPYSQESGLKGNPNRAKISIEKIEVNVPLADTRFTEPVAKKPEAK